MNKTAVCILSLLLAASLAGCGTDNGTVPTPTPTAAVTPKVTDELMPDVSDGIVGDDDGILQSEAPDMDDAPDAGATALPENGARGGTRR